MKLYVDEFKKLITEYKHTWANLLQNKKYLHIFEDMKINSPIVFNGLKLNKSTLGWCYLHEDPEKMEWPTCCICHKKLENIEASLYVGFKKTCKDKTCYLKQRVITNRKNLQQKYGVDNISQLPTIREKIAKVCLEKYGTTTAVPFGSTTYKDNMLKKYGVENPMKMSATKEKIQRTVQQRYGVNHIFKAEATKEKIKSTCIKKYGVENGGGSAIAIQHIKETRSQHEHEDPQFKQKIREKFKQTSLKKYGYKHPMSSKIVKTHLSATFKRLYGCSSYVIYQSYQLMLKSRDTQPLFSLNEYDNANIDDNLRFRCLHCNKEFTSPRQYGSHVRCYSCFPKMNRSSQAERTIGQYIQNLMPKLDIQTNSKKIIPPMELDMYIPEKHIAIEYDGLYWHSSDDGLNSNYHLHKTIECEKKNIQLIHVFENEWKEKSNIVKSRIQNLFGIYEKTVFARKCSIRELSSKDCKQFLLENHIQGPVNAKVNLGLFYDNDLVSLMTFGKTRFSKKYEWEMLRFCNKLGYHVPGAASKLLKHFEKEYQPKSLVSYADRRWSQGKLYEALGFTLDHISPPNYWYFKANTVILESRIKYQKHNLSKLLSNFDPMKTEIENMIENGYHRIFDCGNLVFKKEYL